MARWAVTLGVLVVLVACTPRKAVPLRPLALPTNGGASATALPSGQPSPMTSEGTDLKLSLSVPNSSPMPLVEPSKFASTPAPVGALAPEQAKKLGTVRPELQEKLLALAKIDFATARAKLLSNNGGNVIGNNGGSLISSGNGGYRLLETVGGVSLTALEGEAQPTRIEWLDGTTTLRFLSKLGDRLVELNEAGVPTRQSIRRVESAAGEGNSGVFTSQTLLDDGEPRVRASQHEVYDTAGKLVSTRFVDTSFEDPDSGIVISCDRFEADLKTQTGSYRLTYQNFGLIEEGKLTRLYTDFGGSVHLSFYDPLYAYEGEAEARTTGGKSLYKRKQRIDGDRLHREIDLLNGLVLSFPAFNLDERGTVLLDGKPVGDALARGGGVGAATVHYTLTLWDDPAHPLDVSFGDELPKPSSAPSSAPRGYGTVQTIAGNGKPGMLDEVKPMGNGPVGQLNKPMDLASGPGGASLIVADRANRRLREISLGALSGREPLSISTYAGTGEGAFDDGPGMMATLTDPRCLLGTPQGMFLADAFRVRRIDRNVLPGLPFVKSVAGSTAGFANGPAGEAKFEACGGMALLNDGSLLVADSKNNCIRKLATDGQVTTFAGTNEAGHADGPADRARFNLPFTLLLDGQGGVLVSDLGNRCIRRIDLKDPGHPVTTWVGRPAEAAADSDGPAATATFGAPAGLFMDARKNVYVADGGAGRIRQVSPAGYVRTVCGMSGLHPSDGTAKRASLRVVMGLVGTPDGRDFFFTESDNHLVRWCHLDQAF